MRIRYSIGQGFRMLRSSWLQTILLTLCYTGGFLLPLAMLAYRQGVMDNINSASPTYAYYNSYVDRVYGDQFARLTDYSLLREAMETAGEGFQITVNGSGMETGVTIGGQIMKGVVMWRLPVVPENHIYSVSEEILAVTGKKLTPDARYEVLLGDGLLKGVRNPEKFIGEKLKLYGNEYTVCGIMHGSSNFEVNILSATRSSTMSVRYRIPLETPHDPAKLIKVMDEMFGVTGITKDEGMTGLLVDQMKRQSNWMTALAFAGFAFCLLNSLGIINSALFDCRRKIYIKMTAGARQSEVFLELMVFWGVLLTVASLLAFLASFGAKAYMALYFFNELAIGWQMAASLPLLGLITAALISFYSVRKIARWLA